MDTSKLKKFSQEARRQLIEQVGARLDQVLSVDSAEIREKEQAVRELKAQIKIGSREDVIDRVAYTWFNRFCALRYMDVNHFTPIGTVSPAVNFTQPEILQEAKSGIIDPTWKVDAQRVKNLLTGKLPSSNPQQEAYRLLLVGVCNAFHKQMPFLFPEIEDYTELLMPEDLLSPNSILQGVRETLTEESCWDVEVIGWLYQYYISERKDEVFANLKKNIKIEARDIPAATQLFTPHWIVRYLVENSLGRLWMLNHPDSRLIQQMEYYIKPEQEETDFLKIATPEEIKVCDPACGSGHMLTYAFDLLYAIYEEEGYDPVQIPQLILKNNLFGIEIDQRAGELAAFALTMKARQKDKRFFSRNLDPNICMLENISFTPEELSEYKKHVGNGLFTQDLWFLLTQFEQAKNFGSLIRPRLQKPKLILGHLQELGLFENLLLHTTNEKVQLALKQAEFLSQRYQVVITNPPYMGISSANEDLKEFTQIHYKRSKADLFAMFIERATDLVFVNGLVGMITMQSWMFLTSFEKLREFILNEWTIVSMAHFGPRAFDSIGGVIVSTTAFILQVNSLLNYKGHYFRINTQSNEKDKSIALLQAIHDPYCEWSFFVSSYDLKKIPGYPIAYWVSEKVRELFIENPCVSEFVTFRIGMITGSNDKYVRNWSEVDYKNIGFNYSSRQDAKKSNKKWFPYANGGTFRKYSGNETSIINWEADGEELLTTLDPTGSRVWAHNFNLDCIFKPSICWNSITTGTNGFIYHDNGFLFDSASGLGQTTERMDLLSCLGYLNSKVATYLLTILNPTINLPPGYLGELPYIKSDYSQTVKEILEIERNDWDSFETSWDYDKNQLLESIDRQEKLSEKYQALKTQNKKRMLKIKDLEEANNKFHINSYGLDDEISPEVPLEEVTLTCNPIYRYGNIENLEKLEAMYLADTVKEMISYAIGCMFGRYSLDKPGLILANLDESIDDYLRQIPNPTFEPDADNVIPVLEGEWFADDIVERFKKFLKITFGTEHYEENLAFLEDAIGKDIRSYFVKDFYNEHVKMYKKRPIYWMFSSPNGSFKCLIYMHRYRPDTVSVILNNYLRQYQEKLKAYRLQQQAIETNPGTSQAEKTKAIREGEKLTKILSELKDYEERVLFPLATQQIKIDLDDGVKVNYPKFGKALKEIKGL